jgi:prepilin-type N-terminal cleavage/methylation domain-containing protein
MNTMQKRGFTLIELLVVISIIGLLSSVVLASLNSARVKANDARRISDLQQLQTALGFYYDDNGSYPVCMSYSVWNPVTWFNPVPSCLYSALVPKYIGGLPRDPTNIETGAGNFLGDNYPGDQGELYYSTTGQAYTLGTNLSRGGISNNLGNFQLTN